MRTRSQRASRSETVRRPDATGSAAQSLLGGVAGNPAPLLASLVFLSIGCVVPLLITTVGAAPADWFVEAGLNATLILAAARYSWVVGSRDRHLFEMVLWLFVYFWMGVAPLLQLRLRWPGTTPNVLDEHLPEATAVVFVGAACLVIGSTVAGHRRTRGTEAPRFEAVASVEDRPVYILALAALALAAVFIGTVGISSLFASRSDIAAVQSASFGTDPTGTILRAGTNMGLLVAFVALMHLRQQRRAQGKSWPMLLAAVVLVTLLIVVNPLSSARYTFGTVFLAVLAALGAYATLRRFRVVAVGAILGIVLLFPVLDTFRRSLESQITFTGPLDSMITGDFDAFAQIVNSVQYVHTLGITWGNQLLGVLLFWVPRSLWPTKPIDTGGLVAEFKGYTFTNLSAPLWSEFLVNFGWIGVIVGMLAVGYLFRRLDQSAELRLRVSALPTVLGCVLPFYMLIVLRGSLLQTTANLAVILLATWVIRSRRAAGQRPPAARARL